MDSIRVRWNLNFARVCALLKNRNASWLLEKDLQEIFEQKQRDEWVAAAMPLDVCLPPILDLDEVERKRYCL